MRKARDLDVFNHCQITGAQGDGRLISATKKKDFSTQ